MATIPDLLSAGGDADPALLVPGDDGWAAITYGELRGQVARLAGQLRGAGIGPQDRVAIVLPNGPEAAIAFLAVSSCAVAAPLNPQFREAEFAFYLRDLGARSIITRDGFAPEATAAAAEGTLRLSLEGAPGTLRLTAGGSALPLRDAEPPGGDATALVLHTSGTTARPKMVPLLHANLAASARNVAETLALAPADRCMNVMPLFHIHGLVACVLASLASGGSVACSPGFDAFRFRDWLGAARPTWYSAVPTMHQIVAGRAAREPMTTPGERLRFVRSSSAALPLPVLEQAEAAFGAPMVEAYGMTEASHQIATNQPPPGARQPGSVGTGGRVQVAVLDAAGRQLPAGQPGEVVIKGASVFAGYEANPGANADAFIDGWFRTGDEGYLDAGSFLTLTGRLKEMINRGGEKVAPAEVEEALLRHPGIAQAVVFAVPHERLGEEVGSAIVAAAGAAPSEAEVQRFVARYLAEFKVPRTIVFVDELPRGATGKLQRIGLAERLGLVADGRPPS
ncbi:MAG: AMP-binding protein [Tepidiformaceae bacterium]